MADERKRDIPLCVDLDGTLITTDVLVESAIMLLKTNPLMILPMLMWLAGGFANLKYKIYSYVQPDVSALPYNQKLLEYLDGQKNHRDLVLATATIKPIADSIARHLGIFSKVIATTERNNLKGARKRDELVRMFGYEGFDYAGDSRADLPVWAAARGAVLVNSAAKLKSKLPQSKIILHIIEKQDSTILLLIKEMRIYQWLKNILIFLPLLLAHKVADPGMIATALVSFVAFSLMSSSAYILNDMLDLESDRSHPRKRLRPFASGSLSLVWSFILLPLLITCSILLNLMALPYMFVVTVAIYFITTLSYSLFLKKIALLDIFLLAGLYTLRIIAGAFAVDVPISPWLLAFSMFIFLSLAVVKRFTELNVMKERNQVQTKGRGYNIGDLSLLGNIGLSSGFISVLVFALYINSSDVVRLYTRPLLLWPVVVLLMYWVARIWLLAYRGNMHDDPIVFTAKDLTSYIIGAITITLVICAAL